ncbi:hypothetical protein B0H14DRAFT_619376 [Mycena olivaceomarginata]|nr:hypothetical protein B0H14DRAFT_619376 [Mycena olivaceomarginata]
MGPCLTKLDASHNEITRLTLVPGPVGRSPTALTSLDISNAKLSVLDDCTLSQLTFLQRLNLDNNNFQAIPDSLGDLKSLETLSCADNWLSMLPQSIGELQRLETLDVHRNRLTELPASLWNCASLSQLNVTSNLLVVWHDPPPSVLHSEVSSLSDNTVVGGPTFLNNRKASTSTISDIPPLAYSLELLYLGQNLFTDDVLRPLMILKELRVLNLSFNNIRTILFDFFRDLTKLEEVYFSGNGLTDFPSQDLPNLTRLSTLFLNGNRLQTLPQELGKVKSLTILDIGSNRLEYNTNNREFDWNRNFNKNLRYLNLSGNKRLQIKSNVSTPGHRSRSTVNRERPRRILGAHAASRARPHGCHDLDDEHRYGRYSRRERRSPGTHLVLGRQRHVVRHRGYTREERASQHAGSRARVRRRKEGRSVRHVRPCVSSQAIAHSDYFQSPRQVLTGELCPRVHLTDQHPQPWAPRRRSRCAPPLLPQVEPGVLRQAHELYAENVRDEHRDESCHHRPFDRSQWCVGHRGVHMGQDDVRRKCGQCVGCRLEGGERGSDVEEA